MTANLTAMKVTAPKVTGTMATAEVSWI